MNEQDFSFDVFNRLVNSVICTDYKIQSFQEYLAVTPNQSYHFILRHDIDRAPQKALQFARLEHRLNIRASFYFRITPQSFNEKVIREIAVLDHEIGYHYEDLSLSKGNYSLAIQSFENNLEKFRKIYPVRTICMHGSPLSKWDNRLLWQKYSYRDFGIIGEPYFDLDFSKVLYITDASRSWNNEQVTLRDKVHTGFDFHFDSTHDIIEQIKSDKLPKQIMLNVHPHNWAESQFDWYRIFVHQHIKNCIKKMMVKYGR